MAYSGKFKPKNPHKYRGNKDNIVWRSTWELRFLKWLDSNPYVVEYASEEIVVKYISPLDGKPHRYFIDFYVKVFNKKNEMKKYLIEIKPHKQTIRPTGKRRTKSLLKEERRYLVNQAKWHAAKAFAEENDIEFMVLTEKDIFNKK